MTVDLRQVEILARYELSRKFLGQAAFERMQWLLPGAMTVAPDGTVLLAPESYYWARRHAGHDVSWPTGDSRGVDRPEVRGLIRIPHGWHRLSRPRVAARDSLIDGPPAD